MAGFPFFAIIFRLTEDTTDESLSSLLLRYQLVTNEQIRACLSADSSSTEMSDEQLERELLSRGHVTHWQLTAARNGSGKFLLENGRYLLLDQIGQGGMGTVYMARHTRMNRTVAIKMIDPRRVTDSSLINRFRREIEVSSRLQHEHIVQAFDVGQDGELTFLVLEFVEGSDLASLVKRDGIMRPDEAVAICVQAAAGLAYAHAQGIIHRDIKPLNILLSTAGVTKILDMGMARVELDADDETQSGLTQDGTVMGTIDYMAPEQAHDAHAADARADLYALGATLYFLLSGRPPFPGGKIIEQLHRLANENPQPLGQLRPDCPAEITDIVHRLLSKDLQTRIQSAEEVVRALKPFAAERIAGRSVVTASVQAAADTKREPEYAATIHESPSFAIEEPAGTVMSIAQRRRKSSPILGWTIGGALLVAVTLGIGFWAADKPADKPREKPAPVALPAPKPPESVRIELPGHYGAITVVEFSPDGSMVASGGRDAEVRIWDVRSQKELARL